MTACPDRPGPPERPSPRPSSAWESPTAYLRDKVNQLLGVVGTWPFRAEELDDESLVALDPIGTLAGAFEQILDHLRDTNDELTLARDEIQAILDCAGAAILVLDRELRVVAHNPLCRQLFFPDLGEVRGLALREIEDGALLPVECEFFADVLASRSTVAHGSLVRDGRHFHLVGTPLHDAQGRVSRIVLLYTDITARERVGASLREAEARLKMIFNSVQTGIVLIDPGTHRMVDINESALQMLGGAREDFVGQTCYQYLCGTGSGECPITDHGERIDRSECALHRVDGGSVPILKTVTEVSLDGRTLLLESFLDITERKQAEAALQDSEERYRSLYATMREGVALHAIACDRHGRAVDYTVLDVNPAYEQILGLSRQEVVGKSGIETYGVGDPPYLHIFSRVVMSGQPETFETEFRGRYFHISVVRPSPGRFATLFEDVTARRRAEAEVQRLAYSDTLTGLPNRALLLDRLAEALTRAHREDQSVGVLYLDLDRFKPINDSLGHAVGDRLLRSVAQRLRECVRASDTVSRVGGDEFVVMLGSVRRELDVTRVAQEILRRLAEPFRHEGRELFTGISVGIALYPRDGKDAGGLLKSADIAMYEAKRRGGDSYQFFSAEMNRLACERLDLENSLRQAVKQSEFFLCYQPQIDLAQGCLTGVEALVRWDRPGHGPVSPGVFIPVCEETGIIRPLGEWVLREACLQVRRWAAAGLPELRVAVNLSAVQFERGDVVTTLRRVLAETGVAPNRVELELTESILMRRVEETIRTLEELKDMGVSLSVDDFGTGYSSLSYLRRFPIDRIKIAQEFMRGLAPDGSDAAIVEAIAAMARSLGVGVIAEGVETREQIDFLLSRGCTEMQGYYFARPLRPEHLARHLAEGIGAGALPYRLA